MMPIQECVLGGIRELLSNKVRSFLSVFGIIIGILALMLMMAIMSGIEKTFIQYTEQTGGIEKAVIISSEPEIAGRSRPDLQRPLTLEDALMIKKSPLIRYVSPEFTTYQPAMANGRTRVYLAVTGATRDTLYVNKQRIAKGRPLADTDIERLSNVCVIGTAVSDLVFGPHENPVGRDMVIGGKIFRVVGVLKKNVLMQRNRNLLESKNEVIYVPISILRGQFKIKEKSLQQIQYTVRKKKDISAAQQEVGRMIAQVHRVEGDITINTMEESYLKQKKSFDTLKKSFSMIAGISLLVGGIGVMNIMIASIAQRVREIGIRKAVGARASDILIQFLVETVIVSVLGGFLGIVLSFIVVFLIRSMAKELDPVITLDAVFMAALFSVMVGICFGIYPAIKAAKMDPIQALRYQ